MLKIVRPISLVACAVKSNEGSLSVPFAIQVFTDVYGAIFPAVGSLSGSSAMQVVAFIDVSGLPTESTSSMPFVLVEISFVAGAIVPVVDPHAVLATGTIHYPFIATICEINGGSLLGLAGRKYNRGTKRQGMNEMQTFHFSYRETHLVKPSKRGNPNKFASIGLISVASLRQINEMFALNHSGEVAEWSNVPDSKSGVPQGTAGSNPALSAKSARF